MIVRLLRLGVLIVFTVLVLPLLYLIEPFYRLRFVLMYNQRIGHLTTNTEVFLRRRQMVGRPPRTFHIFLIYDPANRQMLTMYKRLLPIIESHLAVRIYYAVLPVLSRTRFHERIRDEANALAYAAMNGGVPELAFTQEEEERGRRLLRDMGIGPDDWYICIYARDLAYFIKWREHLLYHWKKTEFRNTDIGTYLDAARMVSAMGGYVLRVGADTDQPLPDLGDPRIIDYTSRFRSDFGDIYVAAKCKAFIGCASGLTAVPNAFNVPTAYTNSVPLFATPFNIRKDRFIPGILRRLADGSALPYYEAFDLGLFDFWMRTNYDDSCAKFGLYIDGNSPEDIRDLTMDMLDVAEGREGSGLARRLQSYYRDSYHSYDGEGPVGGPIGERFAVKYADMIVRPEHRGQFPEIWQANQVSLVQ